MIDEAAEQPTPESTAPAPRAVRRIRAGWLIAASLGVVVLGTVIITLAASVGSPGGTASGPTHASVAAAKMWFDPPFTASDSFASLGVLQHNDIGSQDVRFALHGVGGGDVWVGRTDKKWCLLFADATDDAITRGEVSCVTSEQFARDGIHLRVKQIEVSWGGGAVTTDPPMALEPSIPPVPEKGPGDVDAVSSWFEGPRRASDEFPYPGNLTTQGIDAGQVRLVYTQNMPPVRVWIAQQGTTGLCLIATTEQKDHLSQMNCATLDEFRASGISIAVPGLAASWDGAAVLTTR